MRPDQQYLKNKGIMPRVSFKDKKEHRLKLLNVKEDELPSGTKGITYLFSENGEEKTAFTTSVSLIGQLALIELDTLVSIQMRTTPDNRRMYVVKKMIEDDIPVVEQ